MAQAKPPSTDCWSETIGGGDTLRQRWKTTALNVGLQDSLANAIQGHADNSLVSTYRHFILTAMALASAPAKTPGGIADKGQRLAFLLDGWFPIASSVPANNDDCAETAQTRFPARGAISMTLNAIQNLKNQVMICLGRLVDYSWNTSLVLTFSFGVFVLIIASMTLAINTGLISPPQLLCHYVVKNLNMKHFCE